MLQKMSAGVLFAVLCATQLFAQNQLERTRVTAATQMLNRMMPGILNRTGVPGVAIAVVHRGQPVLLNGYGVRKINEADKVTADTVFQIASISKPVTTSVIGAMVTNNLVSWDDRVADYDPNFELSDPWITENITIRDFLTHRSGLPDHNGDILEDLGYDRDEVLYRLRAITPLHPFRIKYNYTNFGFTQAAEAVSWKYGANWEDIASQFIFKPLRMNSTSLLHEDYAKSPHRAWLHVLEDGKYVAKYDRKPDAQSPAGGVSSSVRDMSNWMQMLLNQGKFEGNKIIDPTVLQEIQTPQIIQNVDLATGHVGFYGIGWNVNWNAQGNLRLSHSGAFEMGAATNVALIPDQKIGIIILTNAAPIGLPEAIADIFFDLLYNGSDLKTDWVEVWKERFELISADPFVDYSKIWKPYPSMPSMDLSAYAGTYHSEYYGDLEITQSNGKLMMLLPPNNTPYVLDHWAKDTFTYYFAAESNIGKRGIIFSDVKDGLTQQIYLDNFKRDGGGVFTRVSLTELTPARPLTIRQKPFLNHSGTSYKVIR